MDELVALIADKLGVGPDKASEAVELVVSHLKEKAPALSGQLDALLSGEGAGGLSGVAGKLGGLMGGQD